jgi:hypothetical protein
MPHAVAAHAAFGHFHAATIANDPLIADPLVFAAITFVIAFRPENPFAKQAVFLRPLGAVIDGFGLGDLAVGPRNDFLRRRQFDPDGL